MKYLILLYFFSFNLYSQNTKNDSIAIEFKAKLFTVSEFGLASKEQILKDIEAQKVYFLKTQYKNFLFLKIEFDQPYRISTNHTNSLVRKCFYYMAFNLQTKIFYRLGGFDYIDIDKFIDDLSSLEGKNLIDWEHRNEIEDVDLECLLKYKDLSEKQRLKHKFTCFSSCSENTSLYYVEH